MKPRRDFLVCTVVAVLAGCLYFGTAYQLAHLWFTRQPDGYYPLLAAGFRSGHLYAAIDPHPALLALPNPYDPVANAPYRVHDMTLFRGHYYLYYGVTPVLILFWPVAALTGWYPTEPFAVALFCTAATSIGIALLLAIRRRRFPAAPTWVLAAAALVLAFANPMNLLAEAPQFYQVPISCAIFLEMAMLAALYRALRAGSYRTAWLAGAGLLFGLAIGARPNYILSFAAPLVVVLILALREERGPRRTRAAVRALLAVAFPAGLCGAGLLLYNGLRYGSIFEFGMRYQLSGEGFLNLRPLQPALLPAHLGEYLFQAGTWQDYFPFFRSPAGQPYGFLRYAAWGWLALAALVPARRQKAGDRSDRAAFGLAIMGATMGNLLLLACFFGTTDRYPGDFAASWLLLAGVGALALAQRAASSRMRIVAGTALAGAAGASLFFGLAVFLGRLPAEGGLLQVERLGNFPAYAWQRSHGAAFGALRLDLELHPGEADRAEPLFGTGSESGRRDWLQIEYPAPGRARLGFFHAGWGLLRGREFPIPANRRIVVETRCGSLLPPFGFPLFRGWTRDEFEAASRDLQVCVGGADVLHAVMDCYESSPKDLTLGALRWPGDGVAERFTGRILSAERLPFMDARAPEPVLHDRRPIELALRLPVMHAATADPLLMTGAGAASDLLSCTFDGHGRIGFALDHFGSGGPRSTWLPYDPLRLHTVVIWMGSLAGRGVPQSGSSTLPWSDRLLVILDGKTILNTEQVFYAGSPESIVIGRNACGSTTAGPTFTGLVAGVRQVGFEGLPALNRQGVYGPIIMTVQFPPHASGAQEPLVVTGVAGAGDMIYVRYLDPEHLSFGFDHWGIGGIAGAPIEIDYGQPHTIAVLMDSLFSPGTGSALVRVTLDGQLVLEGRSPCHPSAPGQIRIAENPLGGSTCGPAFTGRVLSIERTEKSRP